MEVRRENIAHLLDFFLDLNLISAVESRSVLSLFDMDCPFHEQLLLADSIHTHTKVADIADLPHAAIGNAGGYIEREQAGYVKFVFRAGINVIFSSIPIAEDDRLAEVAMARKPFLDHAGIDMRSETRAARKHFDRIPEIARNAGWRHVAQGGVGRPVHCCHTQVGEKHWVYPPANLLAFARPLEFAFGPLVVHASSMGCDLRPLDPAHGVSGNAHCCAASAALANASVTASPANCCDGEC